MGTCFTVQELNYNLFFLIRGHVLIFFFGIYNYYGLRNLNKLCMIYEIKINILKLKFLGN